MEKWITAILLKFPGTNCDEETERALQSVGFKTEIWPFTLVEPTRIKNVDLIVLAGGFSYGDYIMAGKLAQLNIQQKLQNSLNEFCHQGGFLLGICNGFQILMRLGLLPQGSLISNTTHRFMCQWVELNNKAQQSPFLKGLPSSFELPIAHAEGRLVTQAPKQAETYLKEGNVTLTYTQNINGSAYSIAGMQDASGQVFGLMPHPERFLYKEHHYDPDWAGDSEWGWGYYFFKGIYDHIEAM
ncbi:MAG: phosphoribosylformylglycinamidine synthase I [Kiritimatiellae bacterium]|nr:phosphoribosylformylglycinamidine synthase I [Kiritimatiellia bacterium]